MKNIKKQQYPACGGIDLGGSKIEAVLFDGQLQKIQQRRHPTPHQNYENLLDALSEEVRWLRKTANNQDLPVGIGIPGFINAKTGISIISNLPANDHQLRNDLKTASGGKIVTENDSNCFAFSEAAHGAGARYSRVFGLILGTGLGGGFCINGNLYTGQNGLTGEVGHSSLPAHLVIKLKLPVLACGCGKKGCFETLVSGRGMATLAKIFSGKTVSAQEVVKGSVAGDVAMRRVLDIWLQLMGELLHTIQICLDPDCIVLGGGLSNIHNVDSLLQKVMEKVILPFAKPPKILKPDFGDSSGSRGAAILAFRQFADNVQKQ